MSNAKLLLSAVVATCLIIFYLSSSSSSPQQSTETATDESSPRRRQSVEIPHKESTFSREIEEHPPPPPPPPQQQQQKARKSSSATKRDKQQVQDENCIFKPVASPSFYQVRGHGGGIVPLGDLEEAARDVLRLETLSVFPFPKPRTKEQPLDFINEYKIIFWATDGTLLNFMRWGSIVNDNDVDIGFIILPNKVVEKIEKHRPGGFSEAAQIIQSVMTNKVKQREWYITLFFALVHAGVIDTPDDRILKNIRQPYKAVKNRRCHIRRGFMQCRHSNGVMYDFFGPENSFNGKKGFTEILSMISSSKNNINQDRNQNQSSSMSMMNVPASAFVTAGETLSDMFFPLTKCAFYDGGFPCPKKSLAVLKSFTLDFSAEEEQKKKKQQQQQQNRNGVDVVEDEKEAKASTASLREFDGCTLFTRRSQDEHFKMHLRSILKSAKKVADCGFPSLIEDANNEDCDKLLKKVGL